MGLTGVVTRRDLAVTAMAMNAGGFLYGAHRIAPPTLVGANSGKLYVYSMAQERILVDLRTANSSAKRRVNRELSEKSYTTARHELETSLDEDQVKGAQAANIADIQDKNGMSTVRQVQLNVEDYLTTKHEAELVGAGYTGAVGTPWSTAASAKPRADVTGAWQTHVYPRTGVLLSEMTLKLDVTKAFDVMATADFADKMKAYPLVAADAAEWRASEPLLARYFGVKSVVLTGAPKNTAAVGATPSFSPVASATVAILCVVGSDSPAEQSVESLQTFRTVVTDNWTCEGATASDLVAEGFLPIVLEEYFETNTTSMVHRARIFAENFTVNKDSGYKLTGL